MSSKEPRNILSTVSGRVIDIHAPDPATIHILDIAHGLSQICRFAGQTPFFMSVLEHSLLASRVAKYKRLSIKQQLHALLHDAAEAYINDMPSPVKKGDLHYKRIENRLLKCILEKYLGPTRALMPEWLKEIDDCCLRDERMRMLAPNVFKNFCQPTPADFMNRFRHLYEQFALKGAK